MLPEESTAAPLSAEDEDVQRLLQEFRMKREGEGLSSRRQEVERLQALLEEQKAKMEKATRLTFTVEQDLVGLVVGKRGSNLQKALALDGVYNVDVNETEVVIIAADAETAEKARDILEFVRAFVPTSPAERGLIIGKGGKNIRDLQRNCGLLKIQVSELAARRPLLGLGLGFRG